MLDAPREPVATMSAETADRSKPGTPPGRPRSRKRELVRLERHRLGPRLYLLGVRVHECYVGIALLAAAGALEIADSAPRFHVRGALAWLGAWMLAKDWRDLFPHLRDTAGWSAGLHRPRFALRTARRAEWLPGALAAVVGAVAVVNIVSALTPSLSGRVDVIRRAVPKDAVPISHALALPVGVGLLVVAVGLARRRQRALEIALALLVALIVLNVVKGLDIEEAVADAALVAVLLWGRDAFFVKPRLGAVRRNFLRVPAILGLAYGTALVTIWAARESATPPVTWSLALRADVEFLTHSGTPIRFSERFEWVPLALGLLGLAALFACAELIFRPLLVTKKPASAAARRAAGALVQEHGHDTLSFFKLRGDLQYLFNEERTAFLGYCTVGRSLAVSGDPIGPAEALPGLVRDLFVFGEQRGLKVVVVGASSVLLDVYRQAGLRPLYMGDEAIVDTPVFTLEGRAIRKVRQSVTRLAKAGYHAELQEVAALTAPALAALEALSTSWRSGVKERGFSMTMDQVADEHRLGSVVVEARDGEGRLRGFLHFVPCPGRAAMSLSLMQRDPDTPNGLTEFMVVRAIELLRERGVEELSLNFAAFARLLHSPHGARERVFGRLVALGNPFFQIESLYKFNAKFFPRWEPRYLLYEGALGLPRAGLAALRAEGQLPRFGRRRSSPT